MPISAQINYNKIPLVSVYVGVLHGTSWDKKIAETADFHDAHA